MRSLIVAGLLLIPSVVSAQDMPLSMFVKEGETWKPAGGEPPTPAGLLHRSASEPATATVLSPDGGTLFVAYRNRRAVWAQPAIGDSSDGGSAQLVGDEPYCPLRLKQGAKSLAVTALAVDSAGRIYAATEEGIQVFDPTGRLSGVLLLPAKGEPTAIGWEGEKRDTLVVWIDGQKYARIMKATGLPPR